MSTQNNGRAKGRRVKSFLIPVELEAKIQDVADAKYKGDFTRAILEELATRYPDAREFLDENPYAKHSSKK